MTKHIRWQQIEDPKSLTEDTTYFCFDTPTPSQMDLVLRVWPVKMDPWVGNFQRSLTDYADVIEWEEASRLIVVAFGSCYFVNPDAPEQYVAHSSGGILHRPVFNEDRSLLIMADYGDVYAYDKSAGLVWLREDLADFVVRVTACSNGTVTVACENDESEEESEIHLNSSSGEIIR